VTRRETLRTNEVFSHESANARLSVLKLVRLALRRCVFCPRLWHINAIFLCHISYAILHMVFDVFLCLANIIFIWHIYQPTFALIS